MFLRREAGVFRNIPSKSRGDAAGRDAYIPSMNFGELRGRSVPARAATEFSRSSNRTSNRSPAEISCGFTSTGTRFRAIGCFDGASGDLGDDETRPRTSAQIFFARRLVRFRSESNSGTSRMEVWANPRGFTEASNALSLVSSRSADNRSHNTRACSWWPTPMPRTALNVRFQPLRASAWTTSTSARSCSNNNRTPPSSTSALTISAGGAAPTHRRTNALAQQQSCATVRKFPRSTARADGSFAENPSSGALLTCEWSSPLLLAFDVLQEDDASI